jgi:hypothetical protein
MNSQSARKLGRRTGRMHAGGRFGDVLVGIRTDEELSWFFNDAGTEMGLPSTLTVADTGRGAGSLAVSEANLEARHAAHKIRDRLESIGLRNERVLETLYTDRIWPGTLVRRFGPVVGVVEGLVAVRAGYLHAHMTQRTGAACTTAWLEELVARCSKDLVAWRIDAFRAVEQAVEAYEQGRGKDGSVVPPEEPW